jgi:hypothetical protein
MPIVLNDCAECPELPKAAQSPLVPLFAGSSPFFQTLSVATESTGVWWLYSVKGRAIPFLAHHTCIW